MLLYKWNIVLKCVVISVTWYVHYVCTWYVQTTPRINALYNYIYYEFRPIALNRIINPAAVIQLNTVLILIMQFYKSFAMNPVSPKYVKKLLK